jgi:hypothetical protein
MPGAPRCETCRKFVSLQMEDPELGDLAAAVTSPGTATITGEVVIKRNCAECSGDMRKAELEINTEVDIDGHEGAAHELSATIADLTPIEESGGRYAKSFFGAQGTIDVTCSCADGVVVASCPWSDKVAASAMDDV